MKFSVSTWRLSVLSVATAAGLLAAGVGNTASATLLWYDGFDTTTDYTAGAALGGQSGGAGSFFSGAWAQAGGDDHVVSATSLTRPGQIIPSIGGSASDLDATPCCITSRTASLFSSPWGGFGDPDDTFYAGFLVTFGTGETKHHRVLEMHDGGFDDSLNRVLQFGYSEFTGVGPDMAIWVKDSSDSSTQQVELSEAVDYAQDAGTTHFVVLKFDMSTSTDDVISVYLDPVGTTEPAVPSAQVTVGQFLADRFGAVTNFVFGGGGGSRPNEVDTAGTLDELRFADNRDGMGFAQVANNTLPYTPVPEPTTAILLGLGSLGLLGVSRRSRM